MSISKAKLDSIKKLYKQTKADKDVFIEKWKEIGTYIGIETGEWNEEKGTLKPFNSEDIYNNTPKESLDVLCNGIEGYGFGRQIPWFNYIPESDADSKNPLIKSCLKAVMQHNYRVLNSSNFYDEARLLTSNVVAFGTGAMWLENRVEKGKPFFKTLHNKDIFPVANEYGEVDTIIRVLRLTADEAKKRFDHGLSNDLKNNNDDPLKEYIFYQYVAPSEKFSIGDEVKTDKKGKYISVYWQKNADKTCEEDRLDTKPFICWRWQRSMAGSAFATECPGIDQLPNFKSLNSLSKDTLLLSQYQARGLWKKTSNLRVNFQPGGVTSLNQGEDFDRQEATGNLSWTFERMDRFENSIKKSFYVDFFLALTENVDRMKTATEAAGLQDEKSTIMSSFFSRMANEFLEPFHEWLVDTELYSYRVEGYEEKDKLKIFENKKIKIDFISPLFIIQRRKVEIEPIEEFLKVTLSLATAGFSEAIYKIDIYEYIDKYAQILGITDTDKILISTKKAREIKQKIDEQNARMAQEQRNIDNAKTLSEAQRNMNTGR